jgi:hypothetical protein
MMLLSQLRILLDLKQRQGSHFVLTGFKPSISQSVVTGLPLCYLQDLIVLVNYLPLPVNNRHKKKGM